MRELFGDYEVIIIGAGIAGISAALKLYESGIKNIAVLEAQTNPGGRIKSVKFGGGYVDLGAQWLHGTKSELCKISEENDLIREDKSFEGLGNYYCENGKIVSPSLVLEVNDAVNDIISRLETLSVEVPQSVGEFMAQEFEKYLQYCDDFSNNEIRRNIYDWNLRFQVIDNACSDLKKLSANAFGNYKFCGGEDHVNFRKGFQSAIDVLVSKLPNDCIFLNCPVKFIKWKEKAQFCSKNFCEIITENGDVFVSNHVIVTCSVGYLKNNWNMFSPPLPLEYIKAFNCIGFDPINKIFLEYEFAWWEDLKGIQLVWDTKERKNRMKNSADYWTCDLTGFDPINGLPNVLVGWIGGEGAAIVENLLPKTMSDHCTKLLRDITGNQDIPWPTNCLSSSWYNNKYIMGGYSHIQVERDCYKSYLETLLKPVETYLPNKSKHPTIYFAGEALHATHYSTTHGAFESGQGQADELNRNSLSTFVIGYSETTFSCCWITYDSASH